MAVPHGAERLDRRASDGPPVGAARGARGAGVCRRRIRTDGSGFGSIGIVAERSTSSATISGSNRLPLLRRSVTARRRATQMDAASVRSSVLQHLAIGRIASTSGETTGDGLEPGARRASRWRSVGFAADSRMTSDRWPEDPGDPTEGLLSRFADEGLSPEPAELARVGANLQAAFARSRSERAPRGALTTRPRAHARAGGRVHRRGPDDFDCGSGSRAKRSGRAVLSRQARSRGAVPSCGRLQRPARGGSPSGRGAAERGRSSPVLGELER